MNEALIGHTGFVGSNLARQHDFDMFFNSKNYLDMRGQSFDTIVCAGVSAVKWKANKEPEKDRAGIQALQEVLDTVSANRFVLISTIDVYPVMAGADESFDVLSLPNHAYGTNRFAFERFCQEKFPGCEIIRLPGLFGEGLKKNVIFDLLNDNCLEMINPACSFQYYDLSRLWTDIEIASRAGVKLVNLFTEPIRTVDIIDRFFPGKPVGQSAGAEMHYDLKTRHANLWNRNDGYIDDRDGVLEAMGKMIESYQGIAS